MFDPRADMLLAFLHWPERLKAGLVDFIEKRLDKDQGPAWLRHVADLQPEWAHEDLSEHTKLLTAGFKLPQASQNPQHLTGWYEALLSFAKIRLRFAQKEIIVDLEDVESWVSLADMIDQDALVSFWLAGIDPAGARFSTLDDVAALDWGATLRATDRALDAILQQGVSDLHIHFSGVRSALVLWYYAVDATDDELSAYMDSRPYEERRAPFKLLQDLRSDEYRKMKRNKKSVDPEEGVGVEKATDASEEACSDGEAGKEKIVEEEEGKEEPGSKDRTAGKKKAPGKEDKASGGSLFELMGDADPERLNQDKLGWLSARMAMERLMLLRAWRSLMRRPDESPAEATERLKGDEARELSVSLDRYIMAKTWFLQANSQRLNLGNPGLAAFRQRILIETGLRKPNRQAIREHEQQGRERRAALRVLDYLLQSSRWLRRVELRRAPPEIISDGRRDIEGWQDLWKQIRKTHRTRAGDTLRQLKKNDFRFALHWSRSAEARGDKTEIEDKSGGWQSPERAIRGKVDQQSSIFQQMRAGDGCSIDTVDLFARVDLAGQERDMKPHIGFFSMNLLRGDPDALAALDNPKKCDAEAHRYWLDLKARGMLHARPELPELGVSCHSGEDFAHPLIGISWVHIVICGLRMRSGDTIGHGLALGWDIEEFEHRRLRATLVPIGDQFDALLWLHKFATDENLPAFDTACHRLEKRLRQLSMKIYKNDLPNVGSIYELIELRWGPCPPRPERRIGRLKTPFEFYQAEIHDERCVNERASLDRCDTLAEGLSALISQAQKRVIELIRERGVIVEINPSSNLRMGRIARLSEAPYLDIVDALGDQYLVTINTDNPGVYRTRIELEYALVYKGLRDRGWPRPRCLEMLETIRQTGMSVVY